MDDGTFITASVASVVWAAALLLSHVLKQKSIYLLGLGLFSFATVFFITFLMALIAGFSTGGRNALNTLGVFGVLVICGAIATVYILFRCLVTLRFEQQANKLKTISISLLSLIGILASAVLCLWGSGAVKYLR